MARQGRREGFYIIIRGPAGIGKSTTSRKLAGQLHAHLIELDEVRRKHNLKSAKKYRMRANKIIIPEISRRVERGEIVVIEDVFYHKEVLDHLLDSLPYDHFVFTLKAPLSEAIRRNSEREKNLPKKMVKDAYNLVQRFNYGIIIDNTKKLPKTIKTMISYLPKKMVKYAHRISSD